MRRRRPIKLSALQAIVLGLFCAQALAGLQVYLSNTQVLRTAAALEAAGYLAVPNRHARSDLTGLGPAFWGGLFFTLSLGAGLSVAAWSAAWTWVRLLKQKKALLVPFLLAWAAALAAVNARGLAPLASAYFLVIPAAVFLFTAKQTPPAAPEGTRLEIAVHLLPLAFLAVLWTSQFNQQMFTDIRDCLLLSNPVGRRINDFYYRYTLQAAEVFKSLDQKIQRTCRLEPMKDQGLARRLEDILAAHDYLPLGPAAEVDLEMASSGNGLGLKSRQGLVLRTRLPEFLAGPRKVLREFSGRTDRHALFRRATFFALLLGFPLTLYIFCYSLFRLALAPVFRAGPAAVISAGLCLLLGLGLWAAVTTCRGGGAPPEELSGMLASESWPVRVAGLKEVVRQEAEIAEFGSYRRGLESPHVPERYWLARALGQSRRPETYEDLVAFLDDPQINVVCVAFFALARRGEKRALPEILKRIKTSEHWYVQWYAYRALRSLGWRQSVSP